MVKPKVYVTRMIAREALDKLAKATEMELWPEELPPPYELLLQKAAVSDGMLTLLTDRIDPQLLDAAPKLKVVSNLAVGYDNINVPEATKRHILVCNTPGVLTETTADLAFTLLMAAARRVVEGDKFPRAGKWQTWGPMLLLGQDIHHATMGIVGVGRIGMEIAKRARGFDMKVLYYDARRRSPEEEKQYGMEFVPDLAKLLPRADFISVHVPLTAETLHLIGAAQFAMMKPSAVFVNTSRGPVVDQKALYEALKAGKIFAAGLDVTEVEPIPMDDPLLTLDNIIIVPHIASGSINTRRNMGLLAVDNILAGIHGELPPACVNPEALRK